MSGNRDELRAKIFSAENRKLKTKVIELLGTTVEIRQPTLAQINKLSKMSADDKIPALIRIMVEYCYVPGTTEKVFELSDAESLSTLPSGKWLSDFNAAVEELTGVNVKEAEKNSDETD